MNDDILKINEPFYSAGHKFGWQGSPVGVGIAVPALLGEGILRIRIGKDTRVYEIDKVKAREFVKKHNSFYMAKGTKLGVVSMAFCEQGTLFGSQLCGECGEANEIVSQCIKCGCPVCVKCPHHESKC